MIFIDFTMAHVDSKKCIQKDLLTIARKIVGQREKRLSSLCFATRTQFGYVFLKTTDNMWDVWGEIVQQTKKLHPHYEFSVVVEIASELFNQEEDIL